MTVPQISLLDLIGQNAATPATATATSADWQHFQDLLQTALVQNPAPEAVKPTPPERAVAPSATPQQDNTRTTQAEAETAVRADAARADAAKSKSAEAARHAATKTRVHGSPTMRQEPTQDATAAAAAADAPVTPGDTAAGAASQDPVAPATSAVATTSRGKAGAAADAVDKTAADASVATADTTITAATTTTAIVTAVPVNPPPASPASTAAGAAPAAAATGPAATSGVADLLSAAANPTGGDHLAASVSVAGARDAKAGDAKSDNSAAAGLAGTGDATASLAAGLAPAPAARGDGQSSGQRGSQQQAHSQPQSGNDQAQAAPSGDSQAAPSPQIATPAPLATAPPTPAAPLLGGLLGATAAERAATALAAGPGPDTTGTTVGLGFGERAAAASLTPLRPSETPNGGSSPYAATQAPLPVEQVALAIGRLTSGARSFTMQLNPEHLGAVDVRMEVDAKGKTKVAITADRPETLALLKLDSHHLVKALQDSGVSADQGSLSFSLREQGSNASGDGRGSSSGHNGRSAGRTPTDDTQDSEAAPVRMSLSRHLYDIHA